jgi:DNA helicase-2/ATP-dependent DNA helicase PcrA
MSTDILTGLNREQNEAVTHTDGPLLIIAGAGTGKTTVVTRRIAWLISEGLAKTSEILALTFTDKAALEMQERVDILVPYGYTDIWVMTFHAFGDRILRENALEVGLNPDFKVLTRPESAVFFREHLFAFDLSYYRPLSEPTRFIEALVALFSRAKDEDISPQEYLDYAQDIILKAKANPQDAALEELSVQQGEIAHAFARYQELLAQEGKVDFGNQFYLGLKLLREHPLILERYQEQFKYILVDEFQDTNVAQYQIVKLLSGENKNITVVADDDQAVYRFRGAAYSNILSFMQDFPQANKVSLIQNYRSPQPILDSAYRLIQHNNPERFEIKANINKRLIGRCQQGQNPAHLHFDTNSTEADQLAKMIQEKAGQPGFRYKDFAILVRSNSDAQPFLQALNMLGIPWQFSGNQGLYTREEVKLCISFLRVTANLSDSLSLYYLTSSPVYQLPLQDLSLCMHFARRRNQSLHQVLKNIGDIPELKELSSGTRKKVESLLKDLDKFLEASRSQTTGRLLYSFLQDTGFLKELTRDPTQEKEEQIQNIAKFFYLVRDFELVAKEDRVLNFINYLNLLIEAGDDPATVEADLDTDAVNVLTIHKAKGLEFRVVFMVSLVQGRFPWPHRKQPIELPDALIKEILPSGDFHIQEERRLFYVGMTRAKEELYFTSAADYGGSRERRLSQFPREALGQEAKETEKKKASALEAIERFAPPVESKATPAGEIPQDKVLHLSYYQIDDYLTCPLKYKYVHILRIPIMEHHTVIYGRAIHAAVSKFFQYKIQGKKMELAQLLAAFSESFDPQGFLSQEHQEERSKVAHDALVRFYSEQERINITPAFIEKDFSFMYENNKIIGRFDRVDMEEGSAVIIDFKSSEIKKQKDADRRTKESLQLSLYALAYKNIFGLLPKRVELHFLEAGLVGVAAKDAEDLEEAQEKIKEAARGIRQCEFKVHPSYMACTYCAYNQICPSAMIR